MTFIMQAPYPALSVTTYLPNPQLGDSLSPTGTMDRKRSMNGVRYAYIKSRDRRKKLIWTFNVSQEKALELQAFFDAFSSEQIKISDHIGKVYIGYFTSNPFEFEAVRRSVASPGNDTLNQVQLEFEGFEQE